MAGLARGKLGWRGWSSQAVLAADEGLRAASHHWLGRHQNLQSVCLSGRARSRAAAGLGEASVRRGIEAPDLHPEAIFPGSFLPHSSSLPWFWSRIRPFPPSPHGCTTQPWATLLLLGEQKPGQNPGWTKAHLRPPSALPPTTCSLSTNCQKGLLSGEVWSNPSQSRGLWDWGGASQRAGGGLQLKVTPHRGKGCPVPSHSPFSWTLPT